MAACTHQEHGIDVTYRVCADGTMYDPCAPQGKPVAWRCPKCRDYLPLKQESGRTRELAERLSKYRTLRGFEQKTEIAIVSRSPEMSVRVEELVRKLHEDLDAIEAEMVLREGKS